MTTPEAVAFVRNYNLWRRGAKNIEMPHPTEIGIALDILIQTVESISPVDTSIFNTDDDTLPDGWVLVPGNLLANIARNLKIAFRVAVRHPVKHYGGKLSSHKVPVGILVQSADQPTMIAAQAKAAARKAHEASTKAS